MDKIYHQLEKETAVAFAAFSEYVQMGVDRTKGAVATRLNKNPPQIYNWAAKYNWNERARAYDRDVFDTEMQLRRGEIAERQVEILDAGYHDYIVLLEKWRKQYGDDKVPTTSKELKEAANSRLAIENLGRKAAGLPNTYLQQNIETKVDNEPIKLAWSSSPKMIEVKASHSQDEHTPEDQDEADSDTPPQPD
jgi:transposase-like protein